MDEADVLLEGAVEVPTGQRLLAGSTYECIGTGEPSFSRREGRLQMYESAGIVTGFIRLPAEPENLEEETHRLYKEIFTGAAGYHFCRFWNFVPNINHVQPPLMENYKLFCSGRARAFAEVLGQNSSGQFPAASATGSQDGHLTVVFFGARSQVRNWENPQQTPAYQYPKRYGPRAPSFARASLFQDARGTEWVFISGTAAIKGHENQCVGNFDGQLAVILDNLDLTLQQAGLRFNRDSSHPHRHIKVFLRHARHLEKLLEGIGPYVANGDTLTVVEADICRHELEVEIEVTVAPKAG